MLRINCSKNGFSICMKKIGTIKWIQNLLKQNLYYIHKFLVWIDT